MIRPIKVKALEPYKIWIRYSDQSEGTVDLSDLANRGVFKVWGDKKVFQSVYITEHGSIAWGDDLEICGDALYLRLTGKKTSDILPGLSTSTQNA